MKLKQNSVRYLRNSLDGVMSNVWHMSFSIEERETREREGKKKEREELFL